MFHLKMSKKTLFSKKFILGTYFFAREQPPSQKPHFVSTFPHYQKSYHSLVSSFFPKVINTLLEVLKYASCVWSLRAKTNVKAILFKFHLKMSKNAVFALEAHNHTLFKSVITC